MPSAPTHEVIPAGGAVAELDGRDAVLLGQGPGGVEAQPQAQPGRRGVSIEARLARSVRWSHAQRAAAFGGPSSSSGRQRASSPGHLG
jgi:hypothetical protein